MNWDAIGAIGEIKPGAYLGHPGSRELWGRIGHYFVPIRALVDQVLLDATRRIEDS